MKAKPSSRKRSTAKRHHAAPKLSRTSKPSDLSLEDWQRGLRRQFGREQKFLLKNLGREEIFSDFQITNPDSRGIYRVSIRGNRDGENHCSCPDFATNTLGTCKHVEFALARLERKPGARKALEAGYRPPHSEIRLQYGASREVRFFPGSSASAEVFQLASRFFDKAGVLKDGAFSRFNEFLTKAAGFDHELRCFDDALAFIAELRDRENRRGVLAKAFPEKDKSPALDKLVTVQLYDYQKQGALFAATAGRCLIGDEMGLGKTVQAIAAAEIMARHLGVERVLIVCPTSLKHQWEREITRFAGRSATVISGMRPSREKLFKEPGFFKITNYDTVHTDLDLISGWSPDLVILDEAQRIKNWKTRTAQSVKRINSPHAIVLTGTPLENRLEELASIIQFVDRHRLGPTFRFLADHQLLDEHGKVIGYRNLDRIGKTLEPILIRRRKAEVLKQLPGRMDKNFFVPMTDEQMLHHEENREIVALIVAKWRRMRFLSEADQRRLMIALQNMRMSCDSTYLLDQETDHGAKSDELATLLEEMFEREGSKVVIFSQWVRMHQMIQRRFAKRKWDHVLFHGGVPGPQRKHLVDRFKDQPECRAFLSTDAGGVGLNLQHASTVINMDLPWNPAVLEQRIGRVHRLGQTQPVQVVNFIAQGTIEEGMLGILKFKKSLFAGVLDGGENEVFLGGSRLNKFMQSVEKATDAIPQASIEDAAAARAGAADAASQGRGAATNGDEAPTLPAPASAPHDSAGSTGTTDSGPGTTALATDPSNPWNSLLAGGLAILEQLAAATRAPSHGQPISPQAPTSGGLSIVRRDEQSGENYLRFPMPSAEMVDRILGTVGTLLERFRR